MKITFKQKYLILLVLMCLVGVSLYYSYAIFVTKQLQENVIMIKTKDDNIQFGINGSNHEIVVLENEEKDISLVIRNTGSKSFNYEVFQKSPLLVKVSSQDAISGTIQSNQIITLNINVKNTSNEKQKVYFDVVTSNDINIDKTIEYSYINNISVFDHSGANQPNMDINFIPVAYHAIDEQDGYWYKTDINNQDNLWYSYDHGIWANAALIKKEEIKKYENLNIGDKVNIEDILGFYVWIPKFKYYIMNNSGYTNYEKMYNVIFENNEDTGTVFCTDSITNDDDKHLYSEICHDTVYSRIYDNLSTYTHPAFRSNNGFWVSKFLVSEMNKSLPNMNMAKRNIMEAIKESEKVYDKKSHLMTNMEYASILILANSSYGKTGNIMYHSNDNYSFSKIYANSYVNDITGCSTTFTKNAQTYSNSVSNTCISYNNLENYSHIANGVSYPIGLIGPGASSTGTIYGVYDLASRNGEIVAAISNSIKDLVNTEYLDIYSDSEYIGKISSSKSIYNLYRYKLGDGIKENYRNFNERGMWQNGLLEQQENGVMLRGGNGEIKNASVFTASMVNINYEAPYRVVIIN